MAGRLTVTLAHIFLNALNKPKVPESRRIAQALDVHFVPAWRPEERHKSRGHGTPFSANHPFFWPRGHIRKPGG